MESFVSIVYTVCGLSYTILAGKGKYLAFVFGLISSIAYSFLSFKNSLWGCFALNLIYYIPIQIISLNKWIKNTNPKTKSVYKIKLKSLEFLFYCFIAVILAVFLSIMLLNKDKFPILDSLITIFSILGAYLTMKRALEQWIIWTIVNILTCVIWFNLKNYTVLSLWFLYLILGIIFYFQWKKEIQNLSR